MAVLTTTIVTSIVAAATTTIISILIYVIYNWATNKNGNKALETFKKEIRKEVDEKIGNTIKLVEGMKQDINDVRSEIAAQRKDFSDLKFELMLDFTKKNDFEKLENKYNENREMVLTNFTNIEIIKDSQKENIKRMTIMESQLMKKK